MIVTGDLALTWWLLMIAPGLIGAILGFSFTGNARGLVAGAVLGPLAMITFLIFGGSSHPQLRFNDEQQPHGAIVPSNIRVGPQSDP